YTRSRGVGRAVIQGARHQTPQTEAQRLGARRLHHNARIDAAALLAASPRASIARLVHAPVILSAEDTVLCRIGGGHPPDDAGRLRSTRDLGYVAHCAFAILPGTGKPCGWRGADVWTRAAEP